MSNPVYHNGSASNKKRMSDVISSRQKFSPVTQISSRRARRLQASLPVQNTVKRSVLDGIKKEQNTFIEEIQKRSFQDNFWRFLRKSELYIRSAKLKTLRFVPHIAPHKMLYGSLVVGVMFGVVSMGFIDRFFKSDVSAQIPAPESVMPSDTPSETVIDATIFEANASSQAEKSGDVFFEYFNEVDDEQYKENIRTMVKGYPIEEMLPYIFAQDRMTSSFLIGIAKKESNWGKRIPVLDGQDCFNYWGYRGVRRLMGTGGHTCFNSRQDAVETVAKRINTLTHSEALNTPEKMIIWKCGFSCSGHSRESVKKWIADVDMYFSLARGDEEELPIQ